MTDQFSVILENSPIHIIYLSTSAMSSNSSSPKCDDCDLCLPMPYSPDQHFKCVCREGFHFDNNTKRCKITLSNECRSHDYQCADGTCIPKSFVCDGEKDCIDDELEEKDCPLLCLYPNHSCDNGTKCITRHKICDGKIDCNDKSDELGECETSSPQLIGKCIKNKFCEEECYDTLSGPVCGCSKGKYLHIDNRTCSDKPPCEQWGRCSQICHALNKSYVCDCKQGYRLAKDKFTCISKDPSKASLITTNGKGILRYYIEDRKLITILSGYSHITHLDFYHTSAADLLFWVDNGKKKIFRGVLKGSAIESIHVIIEEGLGLVEGFCVDWIGHNLYWIDSEYRHVEVSKFDGRMRTFLIGGISRPRSIAVDPKVGFLFWADWSEGNSKIERSLMSGQQRQTIVHLYQFSQSSWPNGITLDYAMQHIYWVDAKLHSIHVSDYHGNNLRTIFYDNDHPSYFSLALHENYIYWTERRQNLLGKLNRWKPVESKILTVEYPDIYEIRVLHSSHQPPVRRNPCAHRNGHCSHLCLLAENFTSSCACSFGWKLNQDGETCSKYNSSFLFIMEEEEHNIIIFTQTKNFNNFIYPAVKIKLEYSSNIIYDERTEHFFWAHLNIIKTMHQSGKQIKTILQLEQMEVISLALDSNSNNLYMLINSFVEEEGSFLSVCTKLGSHFTHLVHLQSEIPLSLATDSINRLIFWSQITKHSNDSLLYTIESIYMDGSKQKRILEINNTKNIKKSSDIRIDLYPQSNIKQICWRNVTYNNVMCASYEGKLLQIIENVTSVAVNQDILLYMKNEKVYELTKGIKKMYAVNNIDGKVVYMQKINFGLNKEKYFNSKSDCESITVHMHNYTSCISKIGAEGGFLVYSHDGILKGHSFLKEFYNQSMFPVKLFSPSSTEDNFDVSIARDTIYWTDNQAKGIFSINRDGTNKHRIVSVEGTIGQLSIDWISGYIYWISVNDTSIWMTNTDGKYKYVVIQGNLQYPSTLAVDPVHGYLFWSDSGSQSRIERSSLSGSQRKVLISSQLIHINDLSVDVEGSMIYWVDSVSGAIERSTLDGSNREIIFSQKERIVSYPVSVTVNRNYIFFSDVSLKGGSLLQARKDNFSDIIILRQNLGRNIGKVKIFDKNLQKGTNICSENNHGCDQLCFYESSGKYSCACSYSRLGKDQHSCIEYQQMMLMADKTTVRSVSLDNPTNLNRPLPPIVVNHGIEDIIALSYNKYQKRIYFSDLNQRPYLFSIKLDGTGFIPLIKDNIMRCIENLAYDPIHGELYWTDSITPSLSRLRVEHHRELQRQPSEVENIITLDANDRPRGIALDSCNLYIFWTNWKEKHPTIERSYFSGAQREVIVDEDIVRPNSLVIDLSTDMLFWTDAKPDGNYVIWRCNIDGSQRMIISQGAGHHPFDLVVHGSFLYWTDWDTKTLFQTDKRSGKGPAIIVNNLQKPMGLVIESSIVLKCMSVVTEAGSRASFPLDDCYGYCLNGGSCIPHTQIGKQICICAENFTGVHCEISSLVVPSYVPTTEVATFSVVLAITVATVLILLIAVMGLLFHRRRKCFSSGHNFHPFVTLPFVKQYTRPNVGDYTANMTRESSFCNGSCEEVGI